MTAAARLRDMGKQARSVTVAAILAGGLLAAGCSAAPAASPARSPTAASSASATGGASVTAAGGSSSSATGARAPAPTSGAASGPAGVTGRVRKILVIVEENHSVTQAFPSGMPYLWDLARQYAYATNWSDVAHPSLPNYLAIFAGSAFNHPQDCPPAPGCSYPGPSVFGQALAHGDSAKAYEESMPQPCDAGFSGDYDVNHNPWAYFPSEASSCRAHDVPAGTPADGALASDIGAGALPTVGLVTPNLQHDGHDGTLAQADAWLRDWVPVLMSGADWRAGRLAIAVVFDEGETVEQVPFVLMAPGLSGVKISAPANQYALTRLIDSVIGAPPLRQADGAADVATLLGAAR